MTLALTRPFGIELEYEYPGTSYTQVRRIARRHDPRRADGWTAGNDGGEDGVELRSPKSTWDHWPTIRAIMRELQPMGHVCRSDGFHLHLDASDFTRDETLVPLALWHQLEPAIFRLVTSSRRANHYCASVRQVASWADIRQVALSGWRNTNNARVQTLYSCRYAFVPQTYHNTFEIRAHQGTMNSRKVKYWILLFQAFVAAARQRSIDDVERMTDWSDDQRFAGLCDLVHEQLPTSTAQRTVAYMERRARQLQ
jgi:hypothetical protein